LERVKGSSTKGQEEKEGMMDFGEPKTIPEFEKQLCRVQKEVPEAKTERKSKIRGE
jgi:hypothetical protein